MVATKILPKCGFRRDYAYFAQRRGEMYVNLTIFFVVCPKWSKRGWLDREQVCHRDVYFYRCV